ncbi:probable protein phosphatase CG10417 isoform X1 [Bactrocera neohumeralis]|uniref:probable protein phosphatase CG10417 isoform X1 n=1 Tax=Bactrocera neohumeralis TaxID=98809 RepID=UPI001A959ECC|nr:probable protein phosphatase CG10417 [Bactrocera tryoni]XP_039954779.1 probable protein phosphatase CG10417 [Bactrocera tryoni]XP_050324319.1 probable protein phosphatase CG10417 isoform X1 [Bactrocera neohumeralis]XP_050324320.1 probable protein phosphatase CG10417 isoform X1 [Bactrocera neohumeralis]
MGAYLSEPKTDKVSTDESNDILTVGASSMQGWRNNQEDAHNSILNFDTNTSFFAVYDGHGGAEVAAYCADQLPHFLKKLSTYKDGEFEKALKETFLGFDKTLLEPQVVEILKFLAGEKGFDGDDSDAHEDDEDFEDLAELHEESHLPLDEVLEKYKGGPCMPSLKRVKDGATGTKPQSPYLRGRRAAAVIADATNKAVLDPESKPEGSSTSAAATAAAISGESGPSSSHKPSSVGTSSKTDSITSESGPSSSNSGNIAKMDTDEPEEDSTVSSSSSSASKPTNNVSAEPENNKPESNAEKNSANGPGTTVATDSASSSENNKEVCPDSSHTKEVEQNGSVSSSEKKPIKKQNAASAEMDTTVSGSNDAAKRIQNGTIGSTSCSAANKQVAGSTTITSTSKESKKLKKTDVSGEEESTDDDADYEENTEEGDARQSLVYSSEDEEIEEAENSSVYSSDEEIEEEEEEDEETALANEQFCADMIEEPGKDSGCTAVVALLNGRDLYVANAGDSRCVVCRNGKAIDMSLDHKPEDEEESARIIKAGGRVTLDGRVNGGLNLSRAIGDHAYKMNLELPAEAQMISALPDVRKLIITPEDEFMVLACDGIWNYLSSEEVVDFVRQRLKDDSKKMSQICEELFDTCLAPNTIGDGTGCDNMTAVIVRFESKILDLPTKLSPEEIVLIKDVTAKTSNTNTCAPKSEQPCLKRAASPSSDDNSNEAENANKTKRLKTDEETTSTTTNTNKSTVETSACSNSDAAASSSTSEAAAAVASITDLKDCDSNTTASSNDAADTDNIAVSST